MKKVMVFIIALVFLFSLVGCSSPETSTNSAAPSESASQSAAQSDVASQPAQKYTLRFAYTLATDHDMSKVFEAFADDVYERTNGGLEITTFPAGQLGTQPENLESVMLGSLDMCYADTSMLITYVPEYSLLGLPWLITNFDIADQLFYNSDIVGQIDSKLEEKMNMKTLGWCYQGFRDFCTTMPLTCLADCQGVKLRSPEIDLYLDTFTLMGFNPTVITWTEAYTAMQSGVVDGVDTVKSSIDSYGFTSIGKYVWNSNHMFSSVGIVVNKDVLAGLPQEYQDVLFAAWADATEASNQYVKDKDEEYIDIFESQGATVTYTKDITEFHDAFRDYWYQNAEENGYSDLLDQLMVIVEDYS